MVRISPCTLSIGVKEEAQSSMSQKKVFLVILDWENNNSTIHYNQENEELAFNQPKNVSSNNSNGHKPK
jgi:hypothetical protein